MRTFAVTKPVTLVTAWPRRGLIQAVPWMLTIEVDEATVTQAVQNTREANLPIVVSTSAVKVVQEPGECMVHGMSYDASITARLSKSSNNL